MMNNCMMEMTWKTLYNEKNPLQGEDRKNRVKENRKRTTVAQC